uniref:Uncharacterized protein n=1 Tax=Anguilla anguilla TaxID=7936 RepID=A0A0E9S011_ANGAN
MSGAILNHPGLAHTRIHTDHSSCFMNIFHFKKFTKWSLQNGDTAYTYTQFR